MVHISQFYACSEVKLASELQYIIELGKYTYYLHDEPLSIDGIIISDDLRLCKFWDYYRVAIESGWIVNYVDAPDLAIDIQNPINFEFQFRNVLLTEEPVDYDKEDDDRRKDDLNYNYRTPLPTQFAFKEKTDGYWEWVLRGKNPATDYSINNKAFNSAGSDTCWVSLFAYVAVSRYYTNEPETLIININGSIVGTPNILTSFIILQEETDCINSWCKYCFDDTVSEKAINHLSYLAWFSKGIDLGLTKKWHSVQEKLEYLKKLDLGVGDVVYLYERYDGQELNYTKNIENFYIAIIREIDDNQIILQKINTKKTKYQGELTYKDYTMATKQLYLFNNPFDKLNSSIEKHLISDLGIEYMLRTEQWFITPCYNDDDVIMNVKNSNGDTECALLPACDLVYWILKDYNVDFNEGRFLERYFNNRQTLYDIFETTGELPKENIYVPTN